MADVKPSDLAAISALDASDVFIANDNSEAAAEKTKSVTALVVRDFVLMNGAVIRPVFTYNGGTTAYTIKIGAGIYDCAGKFCHWTTQITSSAISSPIADTFYYLYLDYSAITSGTEITNAELIWSTTEPTWDETKSGFYNGNDRCVFPWKTNSGPTNGIEFFHDGGNYLGYADSIEDKSLGDVDTSDVPVVLSIPSFAKRAKIEYTLNSNGSSTGCFSYWKTTGQTASTGHLLGWTRDGYVIYMIGQADVITSSDQSISLYNSVSAAHRIGISTNGWFFPTGM